MSVSLILAQRALGTFLDVRGYVADYIRSCGLLPHWKIDPNVVHFRDMPNEMKLEGGFAGYKNAGYIVLKKTRNYFEDKASLFWKTLLKNKHYEIPEILRFGTRTKVFLPSEKSFDEINKIVFEKFFTKEAGELIGGKESDVQFIFDLNEGQFKVRLSGGPIHKNEAGDYLRFESEHFTNCGLFLDLDFYKTENVSKEIVPKLLKEATSITWTKVENIANALKI